MRLGKRSNRVADFAGILAGLALVLTFLSHPPARAQSHQGAAHGVELGKTYHLGPLVITTPWARATPAGAQVAGGFLRIKNEGTMPDRLISAQFSGAGEVEIHETVEEGGVARMRRLSPGLEIAPGAMVELKPGGYHLMFLHLEKGLSEGQTRSATLVFERAGKIDIEFSVLGLGTTTPHVHTSN